MLLSFLQTHKVFVSEPIKNEYHFALRLIELLSTSISTMGLSEERKKEILQQCVLYYLSLFVNSYGYENTVSFVKSRSQWEKKRELDANVLKMIENLVKFATHIQTSNMTSSDISLKPVFAVYHSTLH